MVENLGGSTFLEKVLPRTFLQNLLGINDFYVLYKMKRDLFGKGPS